MRIILRDKNILINLAFILLPPGLVVSYVILWSIKEKPECGFALWLMFLSLLYPLYVPAQSIFYAARELFWGKDRQEELTMMKGFKMFEHLG